MFARLRERVTPSRGAFFLPIKRVVDHRISRRTRPRFAGLSLAKTHPTRSNNYYRLFEVGEKESHLAEPADGALNDPQTVIGPWR